METVGLAAVPEEGSTENGFKPQRRPPLGCLFVDGHIRHTHTHTHTHTNKNKIKQQKQKQNKTKTCMLVLQNWSNKVRKYMYKLHIFELLPSSLTTP
jgi:hypothetical protein